MAITHTFVSAKPAAADPTEVGSAEWNAAHTVSIADADVAASAAIAESKLALNFATHAAVTLGTASGLSLVGQALSLGLASAGVTGALSGTDWSTFDSKQTALTFPLAASLGGLGVNNGSATLTLPNFPITIAGGVTGGVYTLPATAGGGTFPLLATANTFTGVNHFTLGMNATSVFIGEAGNVTMSGAVSNIGIGSGALGGLTSGDENVAIGVLAARDTTTGTENLAFGTGALRRNVSGSYNVALGSTALYENDLGGSNMAIGRGSMYGVAGTNVTWDRNVGVGYNTMRLVSHGAANNIAIGYQAGYNIGAGTENIFIGSNAGYQQAGVNSILIVDSKQRANATTEQTNAIIYGVMASTPAAQTLRLNAVTSIVQETAATATVVDAGIVQVESTGTAANGLGAGLLFKIETATAATVQSAGRVYTVTVDATNASRKYALVGTAFDTAEREGWRVEASGTVAKLGFYGVATVVQPTAYTQTYSTASKTNPTATAANLSTTAATNITPYGYATQAQADDIATQVNKMQTDYVNLQKLTNSLIDDLQALGLVA